MPARTLNKNGGMPVKDGDIGEYRSGEAVKKAWFSENRRVIFVNGMDNTPQDHVESAQALSLLQGCPVVGVFNKSGGFLGDIAQCLTDKLTLVDAQSGNFAGWQQIVDDAYDGAKKKHPGLSKVAFVGKLIDGNAATKSLYDLLTGGVVGAGNQRMAIYCHSQGNLITSNALTAVALATGQRSIQGMEINSFGSPARYWPRGLKHTQRAFTFDPVTWLDLNAGFQFDKVGFVAAHGFLVYLRHDAEFTINRFRWGGWGMTASMDESGLANYMINMGNNPSRLTAILERLIDAHWNDSDDVAHYYCQRMREGHSGTYTTILNGQGKTNNKRSDVAELLIQCLDEGITTSGEEKEIDYIKSVT